MSEERIESEENLNEELHSTDQKSEHAATLSEDTLQAKDEEVKSYIERIQRIQADFENYKKRVARDQENQIRRIENRVFLKWLILFDNFERAVMAYKDNQDQAALAEGVMQIFAHFEDLLSAEEIVPIEAVGKMFDPVLHEALLSVDSNEPVNTVLEEFERGFLRGKEVLRPSRVKVSRKPAGSEIENENGKGDA